jgi:hypothetical protein
MNSATASEKPAAPETEPKERIPYFREGDTALLTLADRKIVCKLGHLKRTTRGKAIGFVVIYLDDRGILSKQVIHPKLLTRIP